MKKIFCLSALLLAVLCMVAVGCKKKSSSSGDGCICTVEGESFTVPAEEMEGMSCAALAEEMSYGGYVQASCKSR